MGKLMMIGMISTAVVRVIKVFMETTQSLKYVN